MSPLEIHVAGVGINYHPAERSILTLHVQTKSFPTVQEAESSVASIINSLCDAIAPYCPQNTTTGSTKLEDNAAISHYSLKSFETSQGRDRVQDSSYNSTLSFSKSSSYQHTFSASADLIIEFRDFALLARLATTIGSMENVKIKCLEWVLTPSTRATVEAKARKDAARHAIRKARDYAEGFGGLSEEEAVSKVRAVLVKENVQYTTYTKAKIHLGKAKSGSIQKSEWDYEPQDVGVEVKVHARFTVDNE
ncbi:hypothetical protein P171DRAFT_432771 [Karstenula rhodostoma CBS 690.94]|uniref:SIMPL domain-containing protein n=1 Tax=Karstenula rhodostoma CBS 690.94 TaxID=1392251 RepID=A0A9P4PIJ6_9PLEO|nr:hypothetical protein P171DRAFT_432771 [Karstenula rhodostoma CBS 690.94]